MTEVYLKTLQVAPYQEKHHQKPEFVAVQITKKECWEGLKNKLAGGWGKGKIYEWSGKVGSKVN